MENFVIDPISQFKVKKIFDLSLLGCDISITNSSLMMIISVLFFILVSYFAVKKPKDKPSKLQILVEMSFNFIDKLCEDNISHSNKRFNPFIFSIFFYIFFGNLFGMIPFTFTFTSQIIVTFSLAIIVFLLSVIIGILKNGISFLRVFLPLGTPIYIFPLIIPIEIISFLSRPFSLGIRLFANMVAGHAMMKVFGSFVILMGLWGFIPLTMNIVLVGFELMVGFLQAYIFATLTCIYIVDAIDLH